MTIDDLIPDERPTVDDLIPSDGPTIDDLIPDDAPRLIGSPKPIATGTPSLASAAKYIDAKMRDRLIRDAKEYGDIALRAGLPMAGAAALSAVPGVGQVGGGILGGIGYRALRRSMTPDPVPDPNAPPWAPKPGPGPGFVDEVFSPRDMIGDAMLGGAPGIGARIGANFPAAIGANPFVRKLIGGATAAGVGAASELTAENPSILGAAMRAIPTAPFGYMGTGAKIETSDVIHDFGRAPTLDEAVTGTLEGRTPAVSAVEGPRNRVGGYIEKLSTKVRNTIENASRRVSEQATKLFRQTIPALADSGDPTAVEIARRVAELQGIENRGTQLFHDSNAALSSQWTKDELNQATLARMLLEKADQPQVAPAWMNERERGAFDYIGQLDDALARGQEGAGVRTPVSVPLPDRPPGLGSIPFQRKPNYGVPIYDAKLADPDLTPLERSLATLDNAEVRTKRIPDLPPNYREMDPDELREMFRDAALRHEPIGAEGLSRTTQQSREAIAREPLLDFEQIYRIKIDRDVHHMAMARAFPGELRQVDIGDGRSIVIGETGEKLLLKLKDDNPLLFNMASDLLHQMTVPNNGPNVALANQVGNAISRAGLGTAYISNIGQRTTTDWMLGRDIAQKARGKWKSDPEFRRSASFGSSAGGTARIATDMEKRNLSMQLMQNEEKRLRGYESSGAILGAEELSARLAQKQAAGVPFSKRDVIEAKEFGADPSWLASRKGKLTTQEAGQVLHDWTTLTQGSFEPGRMAEIFTNPFTRIMATQWRGFSGAQAALVKRHIWDLLMDADRDVQKLGVERLGRFMRYQLPQSAKVGLLKSAMSGKLAVIVAEENRRAERDGIPMPKLWGDLTREMLQGGLGILGEAAVLAGGTASTAAHRMTGLDTPMRTDRDDYVRFLTGPAAGAVGGWAGDFLTGDLGDKAKATARFAAMSSKFPNFGPYAPMVGNLSEAAYDTATKGR